MARFVIKTRNHGEKSFFVPDNGGYIRLETDRNHGTLGRQICAGGGFRGYTLTADLDPLPKMARQWWAQFLRNEGTL